MAVLANKLNREDERGESPLSFLTHEKWISSFILTFITLTTASCTDSHSQESRPDTKSLQTQQQETITPTKAIQKIDIKPSLPKPILPTQLSIPAIKVSAKIETVTLLPDGQMDVPKDSNIAGILYPGILPGAKGNVILDGHVDSYIGPAIFSTSKSLSTVMK